MVDVAGARHRGANALRHGRRNLENVLVVVLPYPHRVSRHDLDGRFDCLATDLDVPSTNGFGGLAACFEDPHGPQPGVDTDGFA